MIKPVLFSLLAITLFACTNQPVQQSMTAEQLAAKKGYQLAEEVDSISNYRLDGWRYVSSKSLIISSSPKKDYLVTLKTRCSELNGTEIIGSTSTGSSMRAKYDAIIVRYDNNSSFSLSNSHKCYVDKIYQLNKLPKEEK